MSQRIRKAHGAKCKADPVLAPTESEVEHADLTDVEAAEYLGRLHPKTLANWRSAGRGPKFLKIGGRVLYPRAELDAYRTSCLRQSTSDQRKSA